MSELSLTFTDDNGTQRKFFVRQEIFTVGRHSGCDLSISDGRLSREHLKIERFGDLYVASDLGSSNGTKINTTILRQPTTLRNGDTLDLGGLKIEAQIVPKKNIYGDFGDDFAVRREAAADESPAAGASSAPSAPVAPPAAAPVQSAAPIGANTIPASFFIVAPLLGVLVLIVLGAAIYLFSGSANKPEIAENRGKFVYSDANDAEETEANDAPRNAAANAKPPTPTPESAANTAVAANANDDDEQSAPPAKNVTDTAKIEQNSASFLRQIAQNDPKAFLTSEQAQIVGARLKSFAGSSVVADNIKSAKANAAQIQSLAAAKNIKPQFLAVAALARLGTNRGSVWQTAQSMADVLDKLSIQLGGELADDAVLMMAVYDQGAAGDFLKMRNQLQTLSNQFPESSRTIRTIWFLKKNNKITDAEYELALRFLAIGTITQNPADFAVNAEALKLN